MAHHDRPVPSREERRRGGQVGLAADRIPADFRLVVAPHRPADDLGEDLRAETDAQYRPAGSDHAGDEVLLGMEPGRGGLVVCCHRSAHEDEQVEVAGRGMFFQQSERGGELVSARGGPVGDSGRPLEGHVLDDVNAHDGCFPLAASVSRILPPGDAGSSHGLPRIRRFLPTAGDAGSNGYYHDATFNTHPVVTALAPRTDEGVRSCTW